jgi:hypothetical protein
VRVPERTVRPPRYARLFDWQRAVAEAANARREPFDGRRSTELLAFAVYVSHLGRGTTGRGVMLKPARKAFGERLTRRYVSVLSDHEYLRITQAPARGRLGKDGRAAEYALTLPEVEGIAAPQDAQKGAAKATTKKGSVVLSDDDPDDNGSRTTVPPAEHKNVVPVSDVPARALDMTRLVSLASRSQDWAGWQSVAALARVA